MTEEPLELRRNPFLQLFSAAPWRASAYALSYVFTGTVLFATSLVVVLLSLVANITWLGVPLLVGAGYFVRGGAALERRRTALVGGAPAPVPLDVPVGTAMFTRLRAVWTDPVTLRAAGYLIVLFPALLLADLAAVALFAAFCAVTVLPLWYWSIPEPGVLLGYPGGDFFVGFHVDTLPSALGVAPLGLVLALAAAYVVTGAARLHRGVVRRVLGPYRDPLREAREVLVSPGPLELAGEHRP